MSIPQVLVVVCFLLLMLLGIFTIVYSLVRLATKKADPSKLTLPWIKGELQGPAWLVLAAVGALMVASPIIAAALQKPSNVTTAPPSVQSALKINEPDYTAFRFLRDVSILDLRASTQSPWYSYFSLNKIRGEKQKIRPAILKNYMTVKKVSAAPEMHITYSTTGKLDVRCISYPAKYQRADTVEGSSQVETWDVIVDVSSIPVGETFELLVEATYWDAFSGIAGDDYTTYAHNQTDPEQISVALIFPDDKPFTGMTVSELDPNSGKESALQAASRDLAGPENRTFFWETTNTRPSWYYKVAWKWQ